MSSNAKIGSSTFKWQTRRMQAPPVPPVIFHIFKFEILRCKPKVHQQQQSHARSRRHIQPPYNGNDGPPKNEAQQTSFSGRLDSHRGSSWNRSTTVDSTGETQSVPMAATAFSVTSKLSSSLASRRLTRPTRSRNTCAVENQTAGDTTGYDSPKLRG